MSAFFLSPITNTLDGVMRLNSQLVHTIDELVSEKLGSGETIRVRIATQSMSPLIRAGEMVVIEHAPARSFTVGDIVVWREGETWLAHRLVAREANDVWVTKGDRVPDCDKIQAPVWIGRVRAMIRGGRPVALTRARTWAKWIARLSFAEATANKSGARWRARILRRLVWTSALGLRLRLILFG